MFFGKKEVCCICNKNTGDKKIIEGMVCKDCISRCGNFLIALNWKTVSSERIKQAINANEINTKNLNVFTSTNKFEKFIDLDETNRLLKIPCFSPNLVLSYDDVTSFELLQDGESIIKGGLGGAIIGGALFGGVGAIVGSNVASKKIKQKISEYRIKILTRNSCYPEIYINFLPAGSVESGSLVYKRYSDQAQHVLSLLSTVASQE